MKGAATFQEHVAFASELPFPMKNGFRILQLGIQAAMRFITERGKLRISEFRKDQLAKLEDRARVLMPMLGRIRGAKSVDLFERRGRLHIP